MKRLWLLITAVIALALALPGVAYAQEGCSGSFITTDAAGNAENEYQVGETVYISGQQFLPNEEITYTVTHIQSGVVVGSGTFTAEADGTFLVALEENRFRGRHEYKVELEYVLPDRQPDICEKSDNFFATGGEGAGLAPGGAGLAETGLPALPLFLLGLGLVGVFFALWLPGRRSRRA